MDLRKEVAERKAAARNAPQPEERGHDRVAGGRDGERSGERGFRARTNRDLVVEIVPAIPLPAPALQSRITVIGPWVLDTETGWLEIHPAWKILTAD